MRLLILQLSGGGGFPPDSLAPRPRSGPLDSSNPSFSPAENSVYGIDQSDIGKSKNGAINQAFSPGTQEPLQASASHSPDSRFSPLDSDRSGTSNAAAEASGSSKVSEPSALLKERELDLRQQGGAIVANRPSTDRPPKLIGGSNGVPSAVVQQENVRPLLSLLEKEPLSRHFSGQLEFVHHLSGLEKHESVLPLLHTSNEMKPKPSGMDFLMAEFAGPQCPLQSL